jgi:hypothetical protein
VRLIIKVYEKLGNKLQEGMMGQVSRGNTERSFCFQVLLKPVLTYGRWKTWAIPDHKRSMSGSQALVAHACNSSYSGGRDCCRKNVRPARTRLKPRWFEERKIYYASEPAPGSLQKWHLPYSSGLQGFYASECGSKQAGRTKADMAVSLLLGGYNIS